MPRVIAPREFGKPLGMYSHGMSVPAGEIVVVAGQVGTRGAGELAGQDVESQTRQAVFATYFPEGAYPPNTLLVVSRLVRPELRVEIEAMAVRPRAAASRAPARRRKARR